MWWIGFCMCLIGFVWLVAGLFVIGPRPANTFDIVSAALFVGGAVFIAGAEIRDAVRETKGEKEQPTEGGGHGSESV